MSTTYLVSTPTGSTVIVGESYNADPTLGLQILDQFGGVTKLFLPGEWSNLTIVTGGTPTPPPSDQSTIIIDGDT